MSEWEVAVCAGRLYLGIARTSRFLWCIVFLYNTFFMADQIIPVGD